MSSLLSEQLSSADTWVSENWVSLENICEFDEIVGDSVTDSIDQERGVSECSCSPALLSSAPPVQPRHVERQTSAS